jgi:hypothetical protein
MSLLAPKEAGKVQMLKRECQTFLDRFDAWINAQKNKLLVQRQEYEHSLQSKSG